MKNKNQEEKKVFAYKHTSMLNEDGTGLISVDHTVYVNTGDVEIPDAININVNNVKTMEDINILRMLLNDIAS